jgi:dihydrofolate synthase/folylpolyglutamate synthase
LDYIDSLRYLYGLADFERSGRFADRPDVEPVKQLLHELGDPHLGRATVHIAGSKGKGSVAAMVESMVRAAGYRTGLFTSPHLHRFPERVQIGGPEAVHDDEGEQGGPSASSGQSPSAGSGQSKTVSQLKPVSTAEIAEGISEIAPAVERVRERMPDRALVTFDVLTALGFLLFRKHNVQVQVIEVGLGGLLDSTNVFGADEGAAAVPLVTVLTNIGLEHREILGDTIPEIARQKAGIIVPGAPAIMAPQRESAADVFREVAAEKHAPLTEVALACNLRRDRAGMDDQQFRLRTKKEGYNIKLPLLGKHQLDNAATAVLAVEALSEVLTSSPGARGSTETASPLPAVEGSQRGEGRVEGGSHGQEETAGAGSRPGIGVEAVQKGLETVRWPGRIEILRRRPLLIVDGAHTADSARRLRDTLAEYMRIDQATLIIGVMGDKDLEGLMMAIEPVARRVIATQADHPRALPAEQVARVFRDRSIETYVEPKLGSAIDMASNLSSGSVAVVILGSIALAGEARAHVLGLERDPPI